MHRPTKLKMTDLNPHLNCVLCDGYFVDATTIVECLHSFCRACIVKYLETNKFCPICDVQVHKTKPLLSIRSDKTLQDVVYKLVPGLYQNEMKRRREFYADHEEEASRCTSEERGEGADHRFIYTPDETISLSLEYGDGKKTAEDSSSAQEKEDVVVPKRYLQCPAAITVGHLKKFVNAKYALPPSYTVEITYSGDLLNDDYTLMDIAYIYAWRRGGPMRFFYRVNSHHIKRQKTSHPPPEAVKALPPPPVVKEPDPPKKAPSVPTLRLLPSPSSVTHEFKFVLKSIGTKKEKSVDLTSGGAAPPPPKPVALTPMVTEASAHPNSRVSESSIKPSPAALPQPSSVALTTGLSSQTQSVPRDTVPPAATCAAATPVCHAPAVPSSFVAIDNSAPDTVATVATVASNRNAIQPVVCSTYCQQPVASKPQTGSKRATRSRVKSKFVQRPLLAKLAPYPPPRTSSPSASALANQVNHFQSSPVTCFTAPPVSCLSTPPVNCLGAVSVSYLPQSPFGANAVNGAASLNVGNLVPAALNNAPMTTNLPCLPVINSSTQSSTVTTSVTSDSLANKSHSVTNGLSMPLTTLPNTPAPIPVPVVTSECAPVSWALSITSQASDSVSSSESNLKTTTVNTTLSHNSPMSVGPKNKKMDCRSPKISMDNHQVSVASSLASSTTDVKSTPCSSAEIVSNNLPVTSQQVIAPSMPVIPVNVPLPNSYIPMTSAQPMTNKATLSKSSSVPFSVNSLLPSVTASQKSTEPKMPSVNDSTSVLLSAPVVQTSAGNALPFVVGEPKPPIDKPVPKIEHQDNTTPTLPSSNASAEKNSINEPFKEVKSSITAEFSDNDDLGCQPDLVVDEQKIDSSDNEDDTEDALRRKIKAIAEKDDEVDVDIETDSGRASDVSNQARSSCDDDIGSPLAVVRTSDSVSTLPLSTAVNVLSTRIPSPVVVSAPSHKAEERTSSKPNGIDHIINALHRHHERKDNIGALDLSTSYRKPGDESVPRPRPRPVANPPVLDAKHRQQTCLSAPTKQHTACVPAPKHPTSSTFHIAPLSTSGRLGMVAGSSQNHLSKLSPVTIPHFTPSPIINSIPVKSPPSNNSAHFCRTPPMAMPGGGMNSYPGKPAANYRHGNMSRSHNNCGSPSNSSSRKSPSTNASSPTNGRREPVSPRNSALSPSLQSPTSPHHRLSPCVTPPKTSPSLPVMGHMTSMPPLVPSTSSYKVTRPPIPIYKKSESHKSSSHHNRFKGSNLTVINPDPNGIRQRIVIKNLNFRPNSHSNHHRL